MSFQDKRRLFQELSFYNMFIEKPRIKHLKNIDLLHEVPFYDKILIKYHKHLEGMQEVIKLK